jgi:predicted nucleic acid-binding protein
MILDTTFLIDLYEEHAKGLPGPATEFLARNRAARLRITIISLGEFATGFDDLRDARAYLRRFPVIRLTPESAFEGARIDGELIKTGQRLGENDTWIAGVARYHGELLISNDRAFTRVRGLKVQSY